MFFALRKWNFHFSTFLTKRIICGARRRDEAGRGAWERSARGVGEECERSARGVREECESGEERRGEERRWRGERESQGWVGGWVGGWG